MSTSEANVFARALYDALFGGALQSLKAAAAKLTNVSGDSAAQSQAVANALPADAPREVQNFLQAMAREGVLDRLPSVVQAFEQFGQSNARSMSGEVVSAVELSEAQRATILNDLRSRYGQQLDLRFGVDSSLIGGLIIRVGDQVLDNSLRARLSAIQRNMLAS
ncbi:MAG: ATP synthase F1 subunit delta [Chloroflexi bacterium SZAS-1]|nr:ATP synthase F1 subunit delta [Chloroflexi bacterium SZAS-1]HNP86454.1 ATP synthase F1 subunit delta [Kouleothrix sp.]